MPHVPATIFDDLHKADISNLGWNISTGMYLRIHKKMFEDFLYSLHLLPSEQTCKKNCIWTVIFVIYRFRHLPFCLLSKKPKWCASDRHRPLLPFFEGIYRSNAGYREELQVMRKWAVKIRNYRFHFHQWRHLAAAAETALFLKKKKVKGGKEKKPGCGRRESIHDPFYHSIPSIILYLPLHLTVFATELS